MHPSSMNGLPGAGAMNDTLDFVRNMWGAMKMPGVTMPSMSVEEINKQIADLKAVESWLQLNMSMLRNSIQALEVQSATLTTLQAMSDSFARATAPLNQPHAEAAAADDADDEAFDEDPVEHEAQPEEEPQSADEPHAAGEATPDGEASANPTAGMAAHLANTAAWWSALQDQFAQAVGSAMAASEAAAKEDQSKGAKAARATGSGKAAKGAARKSRAAGGTNAKPKTAARKAPASKAAAGAAAKKKKA